MSRSNFIINPISFPFESRSQLLEASSLSEVLEGEAARAAGQLRDAEAAEAAWARDHATRLVGGRVAGHSVGLN